MSIALYQVDAFAERLFSGNPAAVVPLAAFPTDDWLQAVAAENNLSETAFFVPRAEGYDLRWFTPNGEVDLCGHATLATAHVLYTHLAYHAARIAFYTRSGVLEVKRTAPGHYRMRFPADRATPIDMPEVVRNFGVPVHEVLRGRDDVLVITENEAAVRAFVPDQQLILQLPARGLILSSPGDAADFVSRCFYPAYGIPEDPVTGSAHTVSAPYWAGRLGKNRLTARQLSKRGGSVDCEVTGQQVYLGGAARTYLIGQLVAS